MSCYFQRLAIFNHFFKNIIEKVKGAEVGQTLELSGSYLRFFYTSLTKVIDISEDFMLFSQRLTIFYNLEKGFDWKGKWCGSRPDIIRIIWCIFEIFDTNVKRLLRKTRISYYFQRSAIDLTVAKNVIEKLKGVEVGQTLL